MQGLRSGHTAHVSARPSSQALEAARAKKLPDVLGQNLRILLVGVNPGLYSAAIGHHFGRPGNRFWKTLALSGLTPRLLAPEQDGELPSFGLGLTNICGRASARAEELSEDELVAGAARLVQLAHTHAPKVVAILGVTAYRTAFRAPAAKLGLQAEPIGPARLWVLPNPSGLNAHHQLPELARLFGELHAFAR